LGAPPSKVVSNILSFIGDSRSDPNIVCGAAVEKQVV
jgi:hypothetical protein